VHPLGEGAWMHGAPIDRSVHGFIVAIQPVIRMSTVADFAENWRSGCGEE